MPYIFTNNATSILRQDTAAGSTTITVPTGEGARFPQPSGTYFFMVTLEDRRSGQMEICKCTARVADVLTVVRAQEGTTAQTFVAGATVSNRLTAQQLNDLQTASTGLPDAPINANQYGRQGGAWTVIHWDTLAGRPPSFPVTTHSHVISDVIGLQPALDAESTTRSTADTTLTNNLAAEVTNRTTADTTLQNNLNTEILNRGADVDAEEASRIAADNLRVLKAGDTMSGALVLPGDPVASNQAARKQYVDNQVSAEASARTTADNAKVDKAGDSMTGALVLPGDPVAPAQAARKAYVDAQITSVSTGYVAKGGDTMTGALNFSAGQINLNVTGTARLVWNKSASGQANNLQGQMAGTNRWIMTLGDASAESGSNAGSNFTINSYSDAGTLLDTPLAIARSSGIVTANLAMPSVLGHRSGGGTTALSTAAWTKINIGTIGSGLNVGGWTNTSSNLVCPKKGVYLVGASLGINMPALTGALEVGVGINSTTVPFMRARVHNAAANNYIYILNVQRIVQLDIGDALTLMGFCGVAGATASDVNDQTYLWATMVAAQ